MIPYLTPGLLLRLKDSKNVNDRLNDCDRAIRREIERFMRMRLEYLEHFASTLLQAEHHENRVRENHEREAIETRKRMENNTHHAGSASGFGGSAVQYPLKSSLKRSPSNREKHVTFSSEPPQIKDIESPSLSDWEAQDALDSAPDNDSYFGSESDQDDSLPDELSPKSQSREPLFSDPQPNRQNKMSGAKALSPEADGQHDTLDALSENQTAVVLYEDKPGKPQLRAGRDFTLDIRRLPIDATPERQPAHPPTESLKPAVPYQVTDLAEQATQSSGAPAEADGQDELTFDLLLDGTETENQDSEAASTDNAGRTQANRADHSDELAITADAGRAYTHSSLVHKNDRSSTEAASIVGSAPIDINITAAMDQRKRGLSHDGGPRPKIGSMALLAEEDESSTEALSLSRLQSEKATDPANMSFSQRMVWEEHQR